jgi:hypothetical protein
MTGRQWPWELPLVGTQIQRLPGAPDALATTFR